MIQLMWTVRRDYPDRGESLRLRFYTGGECLSYARFLEALEQEARFREIVHEEMRAAPFVAFRWETPPLSVSSAGYPFECRLHASPNLDVRSDPTDFQPYFQRNTAIVSFDNLGADARLIVPCPISRSANYCHIGAFHRSAPRSQQHALWIAVAQEAMDLLGEEPLWLNTAGGGVDWLHVRLDQRPKYYRYRPWRDGNVR